MILREKEDAYYRENQFPDICVTFTQENSNKAIRFPLLVKSLLWVGVSRPEVWKKPTLCERIELGKVRREGDRHND